MRRHVLEQNYQKHRGQNYGGGFGHNYETGYSHDEYMVDRDLPQRWSRNADWNGDLNQNTSSSLINGEGEGSQYYGRSHSGKGPKNYRRSNERIKEDACEALFEARDVDASDIEVEVQEGHIILRGTVEDRSSKKAAERAVENLRGVEDVRNEIRLKAREGRPEKEDQHH